MKNTDLFRHEEDYPDLNGDRAVAHLAEALRFQTVSGMDPQLVDGRPFAAFHAFLRSAFPQVARIGEWTALGRSLLIRIPAAEGGEGLPALFMAHQDVVPVVPGTEDRWTHAPFSGDVAEGYIWGRGAMDIKQMLIAELESAEYWLSKGLRPARTLYLAFGEDEETRSLGARAIVEHLQRQGVRLEFVLDEGAGDVSEASDWGAPGALICPIGVYEKGYADLKLSVSSRGGHSSNPFHGTSLGLLAEAIAAILRQLPPPCLSQAVRDSLRRLAPAITREPMRTWAQAPEQYTAELLSWFLRHESLYHLVRTTAAPTMITPGAPAGNVMPQDMEAVINFRLIPQDTPEALLARFQAVVPEQVRLSWVQEISASVPSDHDAYGFRQLQATLERYFDRLIFIPAQNRGATDARWYEPLCRCVLRFGPFLEEEDISAEGIHGTNERISRRAYLQGIRVLIRLMETTCFTNGAAI